MAERAAGDAELEREVSSLLRAHDSVADRFERPALSSLDSPIEEEPGVSSSRVGGWIGPYEVVREVGHGGMGTIYEGIRADDAYRKRVAIKMIIRGGKRDVIVRRFRHERQILANLDHPNIAALLDGGMSGDGQPYIVMEFVEGRPIDVYCAAERLTLKQRLELFRQVCAAVQYAHRNLVVHRDVKPSNILVTKGRVAKLLDFGIAKLLPEDGADGAPLTRAGLHALTTVYASLEQVRGEPIATVSDVYSLGVVLYELVAGRPPFTPEGMTPHELQRRICEDPPARPSVVATDETAAGAGLGDGSRLRRLLRGELDDIVMMALRKEPERRYSSAEQFSEDLRRYLEHLPVLARRDTFGYRTSKFVQRHRTGVAAAVLVTVSLGIGVGAVVTQGRVATRERDRARVAAATAERERVKTQRVSDFLRNIWEPPTRAGTRRVSAPGPARRSAPSSSPPDGASTRTSVASPRYGPRSSRHWAGRTRRSPTSTSPSDSSRKPCHSTASSTASGTPKWRALHELGMLYHQRGQLARAESTYTRSLEIFRALSDSTSDTYSRTVNDLGVAILSQGRASEAAPLLRSSVALRRRLDGGASPALAITLGNVGLALDVQGRLDEAEKAYRESLATFASLAGRDYFERGFSLHNLAIVRSLRGDTFEAESLMHQASELWTRLLGADHPRVAVGLAGLARVYFASGDDRAALRFARQAEAIVQRTLPPAHPDVARVETVYGQALVRTHALAEGERRLRHALEIRRAALAPNSWHVAETSGALGVALVKRGHYAEAEPLLKGSAESLRETLGPSHPRTLEAGRNLVACTTRGGGRAGGRTGGPT